MASRRSNKYANRRRKAHKRQLDEQLKLESLEDRILLAGDTSADVAQVVSVVPQPISRTADGSLRQAGNQIVVHFNDVDLLDSASSAENPALYQLIYTNDTITNTDDSVFNPRSVNYNSITNRAVLSFADDLGDLGGGDGAFRLRINTRRGLPTNQPIMIGPGPDAGSSFSAAASATGLTGDRLTGAVIIDAEIEPQSFALNFPGSDAEPGMRGLPDQPHFSKEFPADDTDGITTIPYNFKTDYGRDPAGNQLKNAITPNQKDRAREIFDIYGSALGVQFYETSDLGYTIVTGDLRALATTMLVSGEDEILAASGSTSLFGFIPTAIMDLSESWDDSFGGSWYQAAMGEIGRLLGMGTTPEVAGSSVLGNLSESEQAVVTPEVDQNGFASLGDDTFFGIQAERIFPGDAAIVLGQHLHRPDSVDIDLYRFQITSAGRFSAETIAERLPESSLLDTTLTLFNTVGEVIARNDDYFSEDSLIDLELESGTYYVGVSASGNSEYNPVIEDTGLHGTSQGAYRLRLDFRASATQSLLDTLGRPLDGDSDGTPGGVFNFWFEANDADRTIYVDKAASTGGDGSLSAPYNEIDVALAAADLPSDARDIVRIVGNGGADGDLNTLGDNLAYELGFDNFGQLTDGGELAVPRGVTVMVDEGAIFKMRRSYVHVGSSTTNVDRSGSALQILGTPDAEVIFTSREDESIGVDNQPLSTVPEPGEWGGIIFQNDLDRSNFKLDPDTGVPRDFEAKGIFLNYVNNADLQFGGGNVTIDSVQQIINPIHMIDARPTISFNDIRFSADAAVSANPDSFEESRFHALDSLGVDYQAVPFTSDYDRIGPNVHGNVLIENTTNAMAIRIDTLPGERLEELTVSGRWDDTDIVHAVKENLIIGSTPGGPIQTGGTMTARTDAQLVVDPGIIVKSDGARIEVDISAQLISEGNEDNPIIFTSMNDDRFGGITEIAGEPEPGDWGGIYAGHSSRLSLDHTVIAFGGGLTRIPGSSAAFNAVEIHQVQAARITNSSFEQNDLGVGGIARPQRAGRGTNEPAAIFVRGAQPVLVGNTITGTTGTQAGVISIDPNSLNARPLPDYGRSRGRLNRFASFDDNQGPLVRGNVLGGNTINGIVVRSGVITTESVWDDTDIAHVVFDQIIVPNYFSSGGIRLESSPTESLVVKFDGNDAGFTTTGTPLEIPDRIGGILNVVGQPGHPVVLTSLADDSVGAGLAPNGRVQNNTDEGVFTRPLRTQDRGSFQIDLNFGPVIREHPQVVAGVQRAARLWEKLIEDPITVTIDVELDSPALPNTPGRTEGTFVVPNGTALITTNETTDIAFNRIVDGLKSTARAHESIVQELPSFDIINTTFPNTPEDPFELGEEIRLTAANYKAIFNEDVPQNDQVVSDFDRNEPRDGAILLNEGAIQFNGPGVGPQFFDYDRSDGIQTGKFDFVGIVASGISRILGFTSSMEQVQTLLANPADPTFPRDVFLTPFDLFRLEPGDGQQDFREAARALDPDQQSHVFYDGGIFDPSDLPNELRLAQGDIPVLADDLTNLTNYELPQNLNGEYLGVAQAALPTSFEFFISDQDRAVFDLIGYDIVGGAISGDWRGLSFQTYTHDRNVAVNTEFEAANDPRGSNNMPSGAQFLGTLAPEAKDSDENRRTALEVHGFINRPGDVDVYSFDAIPGTEIWIDIDRTSQSLDSVLELINVNGVTLARSDNSLAESLGEQQRFEARGIRAFDMNKSPFLSTDHYSTNPRDAGMRVILPGLSSEPVTYHLRVRSAGTNVDFLAAGLTKGRYKLQIRTAELDEIAGAGVQFADIRYAIDGIRVTGLPRHSPLTGEVREDGSNNDTIVFNVPGPQPFDPISDSDDPPAVFTLFARSPGPVRRAFELNTSDIVSEFPQPQYLGNILTSDRAAITVAGKLDPATGIGTIPGHEPIDVDYYMFTVDFNAVQNSGQFELPEFADLMIDVDYSDGLGRADLSVFIYEAEIDPNTFEVSIGSLAYRVNDTIDLDDVPAPNSGNGLEDISRGSVGTLDPMIGPIRVPEGSYVMAVMPSNVAPFAVDSQFDEKLPDNAFARIEPLPALERVVHQTFDVPPEQEPELPVLVGEDSFVPFNLSDVTLFVSGNTDNLTTLYTVDAFQGGIETEVGLLEFDLTDPNNPGGGVGGGGQGGGQGGGGFGQSQFQVGDFVIAERQFTLNPNPDPNDPIQELGNVEERFFAFTLGMNDANSGNYLVINPADATVTGTGDPLNQGGGGQGGGGQGGGGQGGGQGGGFGTQDTSITDDLIVTSRPSMDDPLVVEGADEGVQFNALALLLNERRDYDGFAVGNRMDPAIDNILYAYNHANGQAISDPSTNRDQDMQNAAQVVVDGGGPLFGYSDVVERGVLYTDGDRLPRQIDPIPNDDTALIAAAATDGTRRLTDGMTFEVIDANDQVVETYEFDTGPDFLVEADPARGVGVRDGDQFIVNLVAYEIETGEVLLFNEDLMQYQDGATITIDDIRSGVEALTIELDSDGEVEEGRLALSISDLQDSGQLASRLATAINSHVSSSASAVVVGNRVSLRNSGPAASESAGISVEGAMGATNPDAILVYAEEYFDSEAVAQAIARVVPGTSTSENRIGFMLATTADFGTLETREVVRSLDSLDGVSGGAIPIPFSPTDSAEQIAAAIGAAMGTKVSGSVVTLDQDDGLRFSSVRGPLDTAGQSPGGKITGMTFIVDQEPVLEINAPSPDSLDVTADIRKLGGDGTTVKFGDLRRFRSTWLVDTSKDPISGTMPVLSQGDILEITATDSEGRRRVQLITIRADRLLAVSDRGGLFEIFDYNVPGGAYADYLESSAILTTLDSNNFSGLTIGPQDVQDGRFAQTLFATDGNGNLHSFTLDGVPERIFFNGASSVPTGVPAANGLEFSTLDENLWHVTDRREEDAGHGPEPVFDEEDIPLPYQTLEVFEDCANTAGTGICMGGNSLYFGDPNEDPDLNRNFNYPGGAQGTIITNQVDLSDYTPDDGPALYFNYFFVAEETDALFNSFTGLITNPMRDAFRVYISDDSVEAGDTRGEWHLLATNDTVPDPDADPIETMVQLEDFDLDPNDGIDLDVQQLFSNSFQDVNRLRRPAAGDNTTPDVNLGPNQLRDAFPFVDDTTSPFPNISNVTGQQWLAFPELDETQGVWRQARIDLSPFAGSDSLRLRFDFSTAASFDLGNLGGIQLKTVPGSQLQDGDTFRISGQTFEFDLETTIVTPSGSSLVDGEALTVIDSSNDVHRFEFDSDGAIQADSVAVPFSSADSALTVAASLAATINDQADLTFEAQLGNNRVGLPGASVAFAEPNSLLSTEGRQEPGLQGVALGNIPVTVNNAMTSEDVVAALIPVFAETFTNGVEEVITSVGNTVRLFGLEVDDRGPLGVGDELRGDEWGAFYNINDPINDGAFRGQNNASLLYDFDNDGTLSIATPQVDFVAPFEGVFIDDIIIGFSARGEETSDHRLPYFFDDPDVPPFDRPGRIPDIFAVTTAGGPLDFDEESEAVTVGEYQIEIRTATQGIAGVNKLDRIVPNVVAIAPSGTQVFDGKQFQLFDGNQRFTFEWNDLALGDSSVEDGSVRLDYNVGDEDFVLAARIRDSVNSLNLQGSMNLSAATADGNSAFGEITTRSPRVNLFGDASIIEMEQPNGIESLSVAFEASGNRDRDQGQFIVAQSRVSNSEGHGIIVEDAVRDLPSYDWADPFARELHAQFSEGDYTPQPGPARHLREVNEGSLTTGVVISSNVIAFNEEGGVKFTGDPNGFIVVAPCGDEPGGECPERSDGATFTVTDNNGKTRTFEFHDLQNNNPAVPGQDWQVANALAEFNRDVCAANNWQSRYCGAGLDFADYLQLALERSNLDVTVFRGKGDELFVEGAASITGLDEFAASVQTGQVPFGRIVNNTIVGLGGRFTDTRVDDVTSIDPNATGDLFRIVNDFQDAGIELGDNADPTLLNNLLVNFEVGLRSDFTTIDSVREGLLFQANNQETLNTKVGDFAILLGNDDPLFVDVQNGNFYLSAASDAIDSSIDSLEERPELASVKDPVGIARSPIIVADRDALGQLRVDDPSVEPPSGQGRNAFKDRGAIDRVDFVGPRVSLIKPQDNDAFGVDKDPSDTFVALSPQVVLNSFDIKFFDSSQLGDALDGTGVDPFSISPESISVTNDGLALVEGQDFTLDFDSTNSVLRILPASGRWQVGNTYVVTLDETIVQDIAGNVLQDNQEGGGVRFNITTLLGTDYSDAPVGFPTASHDILEGFFLGNGVTPETGPQPSDSANVDSNDDGVLMPEEFERNIPNSITVQASANGILDSWFDFNANGDWNDPGERVFSNVALLAGANELTVSLPSGTPSGALAARFRFSSAGTAGPSGHAPDGEVEDYVVFVDLGNIWQNVDNPLDVDGDGSVTSIDVLRIVQEVNDPQASDPVTGELTIPATDPNTPQSLGFVDVNGDGFVTPRDAQSIVTLINNQPQAMAASAPLAAARLSEPIVVDPIGEIIEISLPLPLPVQASEALLEEVIVDDMDELVLEVAAERTSDEVADQIFADLGHADDTEV